MLETPPLERSYKGYTISGSADRVFGYDKKWYAAARVTLMCPDNVGIEVERFHDPLLIYEASGDTLCVPAGETSDIQEFYFVNPIRSVREIRNSNRILGFDETDFGRGI